MTFSEMAAARQSCRSYQARAVEREKLEAMIETAKLAPSACNSQPWHMTVISGDKAPAFAKCVQGMGMNKFASGCPAFIVINEEEMSRTAKVGAKLLKQHYASYDIGLLAAHLCYAAQEQGLSTCILGWLDEKAIKEQTGIDKDKKICLVLCVGYASEDEKLRKKVRKDTAQIATFL